MKKYFAKCIPVEGEVKEGEIGLHSKFDFVGRLEYRSSSEVGQRDAGHYLVNDKDFLGITYPKDLKKIKLFLCSRDIQVGDEAYHVNHLDLHPAKVHDSFVKDLVEWNGEGVDESKLFKAIGEISPDATWVKEGDEFDDDEIKIGWRWNNVMELNGKKGWTGMPIDYPEQGMKDKFYKIKGSCGHFH